jgi:hypothetical protein
MCVHCEVFGRNFIIFLATGKNIFFVVYRTIKLNFCQIFLWPKIQLIFPSKFQICICMCVFICRFFGVLEMWFFFNVNIGSTAEGFCSLLPFLVSLYFCWVSYLGYLNFLGKDFDDVVVLIQLVFFCL